MHRSIFCKYLSYVSITDCMECMACSDNTIRAGLTKKFIDVTTLCDMLCYQCSSIEENKFPSVHDSSDPFVSLYDPPAPDFSVAKIKVSAVHLFINIIVFFRLFVQLRIQCHNVNVFFWVQGF